MQVINKTSPLLLTINELEQWLGDTEEKDIPELESLLSKARDTKNYTVDKSVTKKISFRLDWLLRHQVLAGLHVGDRVRWKNEFGTYKGPQVTTGLPDAWVQIDGHPTRSFNPLELDLVPDFDSPKKKTVQFRPFDIVDTEKGYGEIKNIRDGKIEVRLIPTGTYLTCGAEDITLFRRVKVGDYLQSGVNILEVTEVTDEGMCVNRLTGDEHLYPINSQSYNFESSWEIVETFTQAYPHWRCRRGLHPTGFPSSQDSFQDEYIDCYSLPFIDQLDLSEERLLLQNEHLEAVSESGKKGKEKAIKDIQKVIQEEENYAQLLRKIIAYETIKNSSGDLMRQALEVAARCPVTDVELAMKLDMSLFELQRHVIKPLVESKMLCKEGVSSYVINPTGRKFIGASINSGLVEPVASSASEYEQQEQDDLPGGLDEVDESDLRKLLSAETSEQKLLVPTPLIQEICGEHNWISLCAGQSLSSNYYEPSWCEEVTKLPGEVNQLPEEVTKLPSEVNQSVQEGNQEASEESFSPMSREEAEKLIGRANSNCNRLTLIEKVKVKKINLVRRTLAEIDQGKGYEALGFQNMTKFLKSGLINYPYSSLQKQWQAARVENCLGLEIGTTPEEQCRKLLPLAHDPAKMQEAYVMAIDLAGDKKLTAKLIAQCVEDVMGCPPKRHQKSKCQWVSGPNATRHYRVKVLGTEVNMHDSYTDTIKDLENVSQSSNEAPENLIVNGLLGALSEALGVSPQGAIAAAVSFLKNQNQSAVAA